MDKSYIDIENDFICLLLHNKDLIDEWLTSNLPVNYFDETHQHMLNAILFAFNNDACLTRKTFLNYLKQYTTNKLELDSQEGLFNRISIKIGNVKRDDFQLLKEQIRESYISRNCLSYLEQYRNDKGNKGGVFAAKSLQKRLNDLVTDTTEERKIIYESITDYAPEYITALEEKRKNPDNPNNTIKCHIKEIDETMVVGFAPGTLTLICADVSCYKTTMMNNIGANIWKLSSQNVLNVPLEQPREMMFQKFLSRETKIDFRLFQQPHEMTNEQVELVKQTIKKWDEIPEKFFIMEAPERIPVSLIRREIEKHIDIFKPRLVIIDYIANLVPDSKTYRKDRNDLEIGEMLKDLRAMGKPGSMHKEGFAIVSAVQIGREGLKRVRKMGISKTAFYSEDLRGSHEYSADADNIYAQMPDPTNGKRLFIYPIKCRYGKRTFTNGSTKAILDIVPEIGLIQTIQDSWLIGNQNNILDKVESSVDDINVVDDTSVDDLSFDL